MDDEHFAARENVRLLRGRLEAGADQNTRAIMLRLLFEEESKLGSAPEQLDRLDLYVSRLAEIIARHVELTDRLSSAGRPVERAQLLLSTLKELLASYLAHRQTLVTERARIESNLVG